VLDVNDAEARAVLLAIDPLAQLAGYAGDTLDRLRQTVEADSAAVKSLWLTLQEASERTQTNLKRAAENDALRDQFLVVVECEDEQQQCELLARFSQEGLTCTAKVA
jgi:hypothetical protein